MNSLTPMSFPPVNAFNENVIWWNDFINWAMSLNNNNHSESDKAYLESQLRANRFYEV